MLGWMCHDMRVLKRREEEANSKVFAVAVVEMRERTISLFDKSNSCACMWKMSV